MKTTKSKRHVVRTGRLSRGSRRVLLAGAIGIAIGSVGIRLSGELSLIRFFDNVHWTSATVAAAVLAWLRLKQVDARDARGLFWFALGLSGYAVGQLLWNFQTATGYAGFPAPSDLFYLWLGPCLVVGQVQEIRARLSSVQSRTVWLDAATFTVAMLTLILALYLPKRGDTALLPLLTLIAYPATLFAAFGTTLTMIPALRLRLTPGMLLFLAGLAGTGLSWMRWNFLALDGATIDGAWFNVAFSVAVLLIGLGLAHWKIEKNDSPRWDSLCEGMLRYLPLLAVIMASLAVIFANTLAEVPQAVQRIANAGALIVILLAMIRQGGMLSERNRLVVAQQALIDGQHRLVLERQRAEAALQESGKRFKALSSLSSDWFWQQDEQYRFTDFSGAFASDFTPPADSLGKTRWELNIKLTPRQWAAHRALLDARLPFKDFEYPIVGADGDLRWYSISGEPMFDESGRFTGYQGTGRNISAQKLAEQELRVAAVAFESQEGMIITDAKSRILRVNRAFTEITGYSAAEVIGHTPALLKSGRHKPDFYRAMWKTIERTGSWQGEIWDRRKNGEEYPKWLTISAVSGADGRVTHYVGTHFDITEKKRAEERIRELAFYDQLTGLPNRTLLLDRLKQTMTAGIRSGSHGALLFIDLDNFKTLNDSLGHDMGDLLLSQVAQRLTHSVRAGDTVARLGGDEFVVMLPDLSESKDAAAIKAEALGEKILAALNQAYQLDGNVHHNTASIGVTLFRGHFASVDDLMKQADLAMYKSKAMGRNTLRFFDPEMQTAVMERALLEADLRGAIKERHFLLHYQAQAAGDGRVTGAEALVRWRHPRRGVVSPAEFIPLAEESRLILPLGHWVLHTACAQLAAWAARPELAHLSLAVNVSVHQFRQRDFVDQVLAVLKETGANPRRLKLELTESLLVSNMDDIIEKMSALKNWGIGFSLDDFGTGFSSLSYLKRLPLDQLKIDQSFVQEVLTDPNDAAIARTIVALAESLGLGVIAEGVETEAQRDFLAALGCHAYQGYFFSRPLPAEDFEEFARRDSSQPD